MNSNMNSKRRVIFEIQPILIGIGVGIVLSVVAYMVLSLEIIKGTIIAIVALILSVSVGALISYFFYRHGLARIANWSEHTSDLITALKQLWNLANKDRNLTQDEREEAVNIIAEKSKGIIQVLFAFVASVRMFGWIAALVAASGSVALFSATYMQVQRLDRQNELLIEQNLLAEAARRSTLNVELTATLDKIDADLRLFRSAICESKSTEASEPKRCDEYNTATRLPISGPNVTRGYWSLTPPVYGRVIGLARALQPYSMLDVESESGFAAPLSRPTSPERGALLQTLLSSGVDMTELQLNRADFSYAYMPNSNLKAKTLDYLVFSGANFSSANMRCARLCGVLANNSNFSNVSMTSAHFGQYQFAKTRIQRAKLENSKFINTDLNNASFNNADIDGAVFDKSLMEDTLFYNCSLKEIKLIDMDLGGAYIVESNLSKIKWKNVNVEGVVIWKPAEFDATAFRDATGWEKASFDEDTAKNFNLSVRTIKELPKEIYERIQDKKCSLPSTAEEELNLSDRCN